MEKNVETTGDNNIGAEKIRHKFVGLCTSVWGKGTLPQQTCRVIMVLIPKVGGTTGE